MSAHRIFQDQLLARKTNCTILDPGNGGTFIITRDDDVCVITSTTGTQTRVLPSASNFGVGTRVTAQLKSITSGEVDIVDDTPTTTVLAAAGDIAVFRVEQVGSSKKWIVQAPTLPGLLATAAEINRGTDVSTRLVTNTTTTLTVTEALHEGRDILLDNTHTVTVTLPAATGTGDKFNFVVLTLGTDGSKIITAANTTDIIFGGSIAINTQSTTLGFQTTNATTVTFNNTTTGGKIGSRIELQDVASGKFSARVFAITSGNPATPFS